MSADASRARSQASLQVRTPGLAALLTGDREDARVLAGRSLAADERRLRGIAAELVDDRELGRRTRELGEAVSVIATASLDPALLRAIRDRPPDLLILGGPADEALAAELRGLARRRGTLVLGPHAVVRVGSLPCTPTAPVACAAHLGELERLCAALGEVALALAPTPGWLWRWLGAEALAGRDAIGYVPAEALELGWLDWIASLGAREARQLLVPLGVPAVELDRPRSPGLEAATVAHAFERRAGPLYPAPQVLALLREALVREHGGEQGDGAGPDRPPELSLEAARAAWSQARRALPRLGELVGMQTPDPSLSLRVPTAAFLAQGGLLRARESARLLREGLTPPSPPDRELVERADTVLEGAAEILSDQESKVVLRGHGIEVTRQAFANSASGAASFADKIGYPVALKALSPELRRKRELGAVELEVANAAAVKRAYARIVANVEERAPTVSLDGVVVAEMIESGLDLRCGGLRMSSGAVALFAHAILDSPSEPVLARSPLEPDDALLLAEAVLAAVPVPARRRASDPDVGVLATLLLRVDHLFRRTGERLLVVDLAPVRLLDSDRRYVTLDARIVQRPHLEGR